MEYSISYASSLKSFEVIREILAYDRIVILGTKYVGKVVGLILRECLDQKKYPHCPDIEVVYYEMNPSGENIEEELVFPLIKKISKQNQSSVLISADDSEFLGRELMEIYRLGFQKIVDGHDLANINYQPVFFLVDHLETYSNEELLGLGQQLDDEHQAECIPTGVVEKLLANPIEGEACIKLSKHYRGIGKDLLAYEYAERACHTPEYREEARLEMTSIQEDQKNANHNELNFILSLDKSLNLSYLGRSGSIYFGSLLDGHNEILSTPPGIIYDPFPRVYSLFCSKKANVTIDELVNTLSITYQTVNYEEWVQIKVGNNNEIYPEDYNKQFRSKIRQLLEAEKIRHNGLISEKFLIRLIHYSHYVSIGHFMDLSGKIPYLLNHTHTKNYLSIKKYNKLFSNTINFMTIRDTIQSLGSMLDAYRREKKGKLQGKLVIHLLTYFSLNRILMDSDLAAKTLLVPIERLNLNPEIIIKKIIETLRISWNTILLESTLNGQPLFDAYGDIGEAAFEHGPRITGITKRYEQYFNSFDRFRLEALFHPILKKWGYETHEFLDHFLLKELSSHPFKFEDFIELENENQKLQFRLTFSKAYNQTLTELEDKHDFLNYMKII